MANASCVEQPSGRVRRLVTRLVTPLLLGASVLLVLGGCAGGGQRTVPMASDAAGVVTSVSLPRSVPVSIEIPKIGVRSTLLVLGGGRHRGVQLPSASTPMRAGWFSGGPSPGQIGPSTIFGRVSAHHQPAVFARLYALAAGDLVLIRLQDGSTATFRVTQVQQLSKGSFATDAVHGDTTDAELRLVTCGDTFDPATRTFRDDIIVFATLVTH